MTPFGRPVVPEENGITAMSVFGEIPTFSVKALPSSSRRSWKGRHPSASPKVMIPWGNELYYDSLKLYLLMNLGQNTYLIKPHTL